MTRTRLNYNVSLPFPLLLPTLCSYLFLYILSSFVFNIPFNIHFLQAPAFSPLTSPFTVDEMEVLFKMIGEKITTHGDSENYPPREWIIIEKLNEHPVPILPEDVAEGLGSPYTSGRYLCHPAEDKNALAYMRIYKQIPYMGTEPDSSSVRGAQAVLPPPDFMELVALRDLTDMNCTATPRLLGWRHYTQDSDDLVPGGFVTYLVWEKVPGDPLGEEFWSLDYDQRERIRAKFKKAYSFVT